MIKNEKFMGYKIIEYSDYEEDWVIKQMEEGAYFHRLANSSEAWKQGLPNAAVEIEIELLFRETDRHE